MNTAARDQIVIQPASDADISSIASLMKMLGYPSSESSVAARLTMLNREGSIVLVAVANSRVAGLASAHKIPMLHDDGHVAIVTSLVVADDFRRRGIGRRLMEALTEWARRENCPRLHVTSSIRRDDAHAFYKQLGFEQNGYRFVKTLAEAAG